MKLNKNEKFNKLIEETENLKNNKEKLEQIIVFLKDKFKLLTEKSEEKNLDSQGKIDEKKIKQLQKEKKELERMVKKIRDNLIKKNEESLKYLNTINLLEKQIEGITKKSNDNNCIICDYEINEKDIPYINQILNYNEDGSNLQFIKENCIIEYYDEKKKEFQKKEKLFFEQRFPNQGNYRFKFSFKSSLKNGSYLFSNCLSLKEIDFSKFKTEEIINLSGMLEQCKSLNVLNLSNFNTINVVDMNKLFSECSNLKSLDLSNFNTSKVINMAYMFYNCSSLKELNLSNFNTKNVEYMNGMFYKCSSLENINISSFQTEKVNDMSYMFSECSSLKILNLSNFNTNNVTLLKSMFSKCTSLKELNLENFKTDKVTDLRWVFSKIKNCKINTKDQKLLDASKEIPFD